MSKKQLEKSKKHLKKAEDLLAHNLVILKSSYNVTASDMKILRGIIVLYGNANYLYGIDLGEETY